ncbi:MAG: molybdenum cofactor cytidylyltransferase [Alphaproteobacteria bacterium]|jgi:molybdenum cofactor cytidylyltransferase
MIKPPAIAAIVLAAGRSTRAGEINKLTAPLDGVPMAARAVDAVLATVARPVIVVTGHQASAVQGALVGREVSFVHNPDFAAGINTSIAAGLKALPDDVAGALICLGDMPSLTAVAIACLIAAFDEDTAPICVPVAGGRRGNPVLFARALFPEIMALTGDAGARAVLAAHPGMVREIPMSGEGTLTDLDTADEIDAYNRK